MKAFKYQTLEGSDTGIDDTALNHMGDMGWELVTTIAVFKVRKQKQVYKYIFKMEIADRKRIKVKSNNGYIETITQ